MVSEEEEEEEDRVSPHLVITSPENLLKNIVAKNATRCNDQKIIL